MPLFQTEAEEIDESISVMSTTFYSRDPSVPFWRSNSDVDALFDALSEQATFEKAVMMRGHFELGMLGYHTYELHANAYR